MLFIRQINKITFKTYTEKLSYIPQILKRLTLRLYGTVPVYSGQGVCRSLWSNIANNFKLMITYVFKYHSTMILYLCDPGFICKCFNFKNEINFSWGKSGICSCMLHFDTHQWGTMGKGQSAIISFCVVVTQSLPAEGFQLSQWYSGVPRRVTIIGIDYESTPILFSTHGQSIKVISSNICSLFVSNFTDNSTQGIENFLEK